MFRDTHDIKYCTLSETQTEGKNPEDGKRIPFGWRALQIPECEEGKIVFLKHLLPIFQDEISNGGARFRISIALDIREEKMLEAFNPETERVLHLYILQKKLQAKFLLIPKLQ